jgi:fatty-acyl-CoA synthase
VSGVEGATVAALFAARRGDDGGGLVVAGTDERWSWAEVVAEADARAGLLDELGPPGRHIGVLLDNVPEYVFLLGAAARTGSVVVGINPTRRGEELARDVRHTDCVAVCTTSAQAGLLAGLDLGGAEVIAVDEQGWASRVDAHRSAGAESSPGASPDDLYLLIFTSGSTGAPKAVRVSQGRVARTAAAAAAAFGPQDALYCSMPLFHANSLLANVFPALMAGATVVLRDRFSASGFVDDVRRHGCTYFNYVGRALSYVLETPERPDDADNALVWGMGSEASPRDRKEFRRRFGCFIYEGYGSSEGSIVIIAYPGMPRGALGRPQEGMDVTVVDPATGEETAVAELDDEGRLLNAADAVGEIVGRNVLGSFEGYYANDEATAARSRNGWYWSGDLGYRDATGTFWFAGRGSDWLRVDGENFAAGPVERILGRFPSVAAVLVYGVPDPVTGDQVMAALELDHDVAFDPDAFVRFLGEQPDLGTKWTPRFVRVTRRLPQTANGKLDRAPLRADRWETDDPVWWRPGRAVAFRPFTPDDGAELRAAFAAAGREAMLSVAAADDEVAG